MDFTETPGAEDLDEELGQLLSDYYQDRTVTPETICMVLQAALEEWGCLT
jgi:hypothetical protein